MTDNLSIKGITPADQEPGRRMKTRRGRKPYAIECRYSLPTGEKDTGLGWLWKSLSEWYTHGRYRTAKDRDEAFKALVRKTHLDYPYGGRRPEYRKVDPDG